MKNATEIVLVLDRSSSMNYIKSATIEGFNSFLKQQQSVPGEAHFTLVEFNTEVCGHPRINLTDVKELTDKTYHCTGCTALLDALGIAIDRLGEKLLQLSENDRPDKVVFVILTDGEENSSKEYTLTSIRQRIQHQQEKYNWQFMFLGANIDAFGEAHKLGINLSNVSQFTPDNAGVRSAYCCSGEALARYRMSNDVNALSINTSNSDNNALIIDTSDSVNKDT